MIRIVAALLCVPLALGAYLAALGPVDLPMAVALIGGREPKNFEDAVLLYSVAPRATLAVLGGAALGLAGSLLQQVTLNRMVSPLTLGTSAGSWLALTVGAVLFPTLVATQPLWFSLSGAVFATGFVVLIAGRQGIAGLPVVLAGMAVNILMGALATLVVLLNDERVRNLFIWGAGDLTQTDWHWVEWLLPQVGIGMLLMLFCLRPLTLMRLGTSGATARGLSTGPFLLIIWAIAVWQTASVISAVGVIGFIGLMAPNLARLAGGRTAGREIGLSILIGAALLLGTDALAVVVSEYSRDLVPTGAAAALVGLPVLIRMATEPLKAQDHVPFRLPEGLVRLPMGMAAAVACMLPIVLIASLLVGRGLEGWSFGWPSDLALHLRWPRVLTALAAGSGMAISGVLLQRLLRNPLASPEFVGITSGATLAIVCAFVFFGVRVSEGGPVIALIGSLCVLAALLLLSSRQRNAPNAVVLIGISLWALSEALLQFALAKGGEETYMLVGWLAGTTFRADSAQSAGLIGVVGALFLVSVMLRRWAGLVSIGDAIANARGLNATMARNSLLILAAVVAASVTAVVGPIAFIGLIAPHAAALLGAKKVGQQLLISALIGAELLVMADWLGRTLVFPQQLPAGATAAAMGGCYFLILLALRGGIGASRNEMRRTITRGFQFCGRIVHYRFHG